MSDRSAIEWTDATWNPVTGCSKVSPGCAHCYAETLSLRYGWSQVPWTPENAARNVVLHAERLEQPLRWRRPRMVFVNSMSDLFHERVPGDYRRDVWKVMDRVRRHTFQVLTKRPELMRDWVTANADITDPVVPNVWLGTSIENNRWAHRADDLRDTPAAVRFISAEPLLGPLNMLDLTGIDWLIVGGESGPRHRPMEHDWVLELRDHALAAGVAFFFKQWGGRTPKAGGRLLDGRTWDEYPGTRPSSVPPAGLEVRPVARPHPIEALPGIR
ncbi:MAG: phage Gp37/Gp68 family protein [Chloroflexota bacterium]